MQTNHSQVRVGKHAGDHLTAPRATGEEKMEGGVPILARKVGRGGGGQRQSRSHRRPDRHSQGLSSSHDCHHIARFDVVFSLNSHAAQLNHNRMRRQRNMQLAFVVTDSCAVRSLGLVLEKTPHSVLRAYLAGTLVAMADNQLLQLQTPSL
jgi:hypothetical protein